MHVPIYVTGKITGTCINILAGVTVHVNNATMSIVRHNQYAVDPWLHNIG